MSRGDEAAFPFHRSGEAAQPGLTIREYISIEILAKLVASRTDVELSLPWCVRKADEAADLWLEQRAKRNAKPANGGGN